MCCFLDVELKGPIGFKLVGGSIPVPHDFEWFLRENQKHIRKEKVAEGALFYEITITQKILEFGV